MTEPVPTKFVRVPIEEWVGPSGQSEKRIVHCLVNPRHVAMLRPIYTSGVLTGGILHTVKDYGTLTIPGEHYHQTFLDIESSLP